MQLIQAFFIGRPAPIADPKTGKLMITNVGVPLIIIVCYVMNKAVCWMVDVWVFTREEEEEEEEEECPNPTPPPPA